MRSILVAAVLLLTLPAEAQRLRRIVETRDAGIDAISIDQDGDTVVACWEGDPFGTNPDRDNRLYRWSPPATTPVLLGDCSGGTSMTDDGLVVAVTSRDDPFGTNADGSVEIFLRSTVDGTVLSQVTDLANVAGEIEHFAISGDGSRLVYGGAFDPLGLNPSLHEQLFTVSSNGVVTRPLTFHSSATTIEGAAISDDGQRVIFTSDLGGNQPEIFRVDWSGANLTAVPFSDVHGLALSGDGQTIAVQVGRFAPTIHVADWAGGSVEIGPGSDPDLTDDGLDVYYTERQADNDADIVAAPVGQGQGFAVTNTPAPIHNRRAVVSGDGTHLAFESEFGSWAAIANDDGATELAWSSTSGLSLTRLTENGPLTGKVRMLDISPDGTQVAFDNSFASEGLFVIEPDGIGLRRLTMGRTVYGLDFLPDGASIGFSEEKDLLAVNGCDPVKRLRSHLYSVGIDGGGLTQLSQAGDCDDTYLHVDAHSGGMTYERGAVYDLAVGGAPIELFDLDHTNVNKQPAVDDAGGWVVLRSDPDGTGVLPARAWRVRTDGSGLELLVEGVIDPPVISSDGTRVAVNAAWDPLGTNPEGNVELFVLDFPGPTITQLTDTVDRSIFSLRISGDGSWIWFDSNIDYFGNGTTDGMYRIEVATGRVERLQGLALQLFCADEGISRALCYSVGTSGDRGAILTQDTPDGLPNPPNREAIFLLEFDAPGDIQPSAATPTTVSWDVDPRFISYDVIRGDVAALGPGGNLGPVVCLDEDSNDALAEDLVAPLPGQAFFYLRRGRAGPAVASEAWGHASDGTERQPAAGGCTD